MARIIGSGIRIKLGIWRVNLGDRHLASSLVAEDPVESGEMTLSATLTQTRTRTSGEFGLKLYTDTDTQHTPLCNVSVQTKLKCECGSILGFLISC